MRLTSQEHDHHAARRARKSFVIVVLVLAITMLAWAWLESRSLASPTALALVFGLALISCCGVLLWRLQAADRDTRELARALDQQIGALERARERAEISSTAKSSFLANMSHELRTPLNAIIGYAELVAEELGDRSQVSQDQGSQDQFGSLGTDIEKIQLSARHLLGLINDILDISKIEAGEVKVEVRSVDIERVIREVRAAVELQIKARGNSLVLDVAPELGALDSDTAKLRQILINLLGNAAKFTDDGTITLRITAVSDFALRFDIVDTGIGIAPHKLELLFEPFVQADASSSRRAGGTGLGLAISRHYAKLLGGSLTAESEPGRGSTFTLIVPRRLGAVHSDHST